MKLRASTVVASVFGIGYFEFAQGTIMSAVATPLAFLIMLRAGAISLVCAALIVFCMASSPAPTICAKPAATTRPNA